MNVDCTAVYSLSICDNIAENTGNHSAIVEEIEKKKFALI